MLLTVLTLVLAGLMPVRSQTNTPLTKTFVMSLETPGPMDRATASPFDPSNNAIANAAAQAVGQLTNTANQIAAVVGLTPPQPLNPADPGMAAAAAEQMLMMLANGIMANQVADQQVMQIMQLMRLMQLMQLGGALAAAGNPTPAAMGGAPTPALMGVPAPTPALMGVPAPTPALMGIPAPAAMGANAPGADPMRAMVAGQLMGLASQLMAAAANAAGDGGGGGAGLAPVTATQGFAMNGDAQSNIDQVARIAPGQLAALGGQIAAMNAINGNGPNPIATIAVDELMPAMANPIATMVVMNPPGIVPIATMAIDMSIPAMGSAICTMVLMDPPGPAPIATMVVDGLMPSMPFMASPVATMVMMNPPGIQPMGTIMVGSTMPPMMGQPIATMVVMSSDGPNPIATMMVDQLMPVVANPVATMFMMNPGSNNPVGSMVVSQLMPVMNNPVATMVVGSMVGMGSVAIGMGSIVVVGSMVAPGGITAAINANGASFPAFNANAFNAGAGQGAAANNAGGFPAFNANAFNGANAGGGGGVPANTGGSFPAFNANGDNAGGGGGVPAINVGGFPAFNAGMAAGGGPAINAAMTSGRLRAANSSGALLNATTGRGPGLPIMPTPVMGRVPQNQRTSGPLPGVPNAIRPRSPIYPPSPEAGYGQYARTPCGFPNAMPAMRNFRPEGAHGLWYTYRQVTSDGVQTINPRFYVRELDKTVVAGTGIPAEYQLWISSSYLRNRCRYDYWVGTVGRDGSERGVEYSADNGFTPAPSNLVAVLYDYDRLSIDYGCDRPNYRTGVCDEPVVFVSTRKRPSKLSQNERREIDAVVNSVFGQYCISAADLPLQPFVDGKPDCDFREPPRSILREGRY